MQTPKSVKIQYDHVNTFNRPLDCGLPSSFICLQIYIQLTSLTKRRWNKKDHNSKTEDTGRRIPLESLTFKPTRFHFPPVYVKAQEHLFHFPCVGAGEVAQKKSPTWLRAESISPNTCTKAFSAPPKIAQACLSAGSLRLTEVSGIYS